MIEGNINSLTIIYTVFLVPPKYHLRQHILFPKLWLYSADMGVIIRHFLEKKHGSSKCTFLCQALHKHTWRDTAPSLGIRKAMCERQEVQFFSLLQKSRNRGGYARDQRVLMAKLRVEAKYGALDNCCLTIRSCLLEISWLDPTLQ